MNLKYVLPILAMGAMTYTQASAKKTLKSGISLENLDRTAKPGTDFYQFACGGWIKNNPMPADRSRYGTFDVLAENCTKQVQGLIQELSSKKQSKGSVAQKIGSLYRLAMDSVRLNEQKMAPVLPLLKTISEVKTNAEAMKLMAQYRLIGMGGFFGVYVDADMKDSKNNLVQLYQGGLTLGEKDYYIGRDEATLKVREAYKKHIVNMFKLAGFTEAEAKEKMLSVLNIETRLAIASYSATEQRDPASNYHKMAIEKLYADYSGIDWKSYFSILGITGIKEISVSQPEPIHEVERILAEVPTSQIKDYMQWQALDAAASFLDDATRAENFNFYGRILSGSKEDRPRWKRAVGVVNGTLGEAVGQMYVKKYFPESSKKRMEQLVHNLQVALAERIKAQDWMSDSTKNVAIDKLNAFYVKIGYPNKWKDYSSMDIDENISYFANIMRANEWGWKDMLQRKLNKPVDRDEWGMTPQTVNAYYNPTTNEICFPAGILQPPFFNPEADDACNYGAIGVVIGHEMTHGFDDQGSQFDKNGNFRNWWSASDKARFQEKTKALADYFSKITVLPGLKANGKLTLGENLADHGGLNIAYIAYKNATKNNPLKTVDGFTPDQRFYLAYATLWAGSITDEQIRVYTKTDPHSLAKWRVDGALPQINEWYDAFGITEKDPMFIPKDQRVNVW